MNAMVQSRIYISLLALKKAPKKEMWDCIDCVCHNLARVNGNLLLLRHSTGYKTMDNESCKADLGRFFDDPYI